MDFLVVPTINFRLPFVLVILRHERRRLISLSVTDHPTAESTARQITEAFPWDSAPTHLVRDRVASYGHAVTMRLAAICIRDHPIAPRSPWQNGHAKRLIGSIRRQCLDHLVIFGEAHLRQILKAYATYYNNVRPHLSLAKDAPLMRPIQRFGNIAATPILGGSSILPDVVFSRDRRSSLFRRRRSRSTLLGCHLLPRGPSTPRLFNSAPMALTETKPAFRKLQIAAARALARASAGPLFASLLLVLPLPSVTRPKRVSSFTTMMRCHWPPRGAGIPFRFNAAAVPLEARRPQLPNLGSKAMARSFAVCLVASLPRIGRRPRAETFSRRFVGPSWPAG